MRVLEEPLVEPGVRKEKRPRVPPARPETPPMDPAAEPQPGIDITCARPHEVDALVLAAEKVGWSIERRVRNPHLGAVIWVNTREETMDRWKVLRPGEWLSHMPGIGSACEKDILAKALESSRASFWPRSWCTGDSFLVSDVCDEVFSCSALPSSLIVKPTTGTHGKGISLVRTRDELLAAVEKLRSQGERQQEAIVQEYVERPMLLGGHKWDARLYALILRQPAESSEKGRNSKGLCCLLAQEGLVRVCVDPYEQPEPRNLHRSTMHLSNYSISRMSEKYVHNADVDDGGQGCKRTLSAVLRHLEREEGLVKEDFWRSVHHLVRGTVDAMAASVLESFEALDRAAAEANAAEAAKAKSAEAVKAEAETMKPEASSPLPRGCFHLVGLDVLLDQAGAPWLLEVNSNPSLSLEEVKPLESSLSVADTHRLFAEVSSMKGFSRWGRPCRCAKLPRPHAHYQCPVDSKVKLPVVEGTLNVIRRVAQGEPGGIDAWSKGTIFNPV